MTCTVAAQFYGRKELYKQYRQLGSSRCFSRDPRTKLNNSAPDTSTERTLCTLPHPPFVLCSMSWHHSILREKVTVAINVYKRGRPAKHCRIKCQCFSVRFVPTYLWQTSTSSRGFTSVLHKNIFINVMLFFVTLIFCISWLCQACLRINSIKTKQLATLHPYVFILLSQKNVLPVMLEQCFSTFWHQGILCLVLLKTWSPLNKKRTKPERKKCVLLSHKFDLCTYTWLHDVRSYAKIIASKYPNLNSRNPCETLGALGRLAEELSTGPLLLKLCYVEHSTNIYSGGLYVVQMTRILSSFLF